MKRIALVVFFTLLTLSAVATTISPLTPVSATNSGWKNGILLHRSADGAFEFRFDTRIYLDTGIVFENKNPLSSGTGLRRGRLGLKTRLWQNWAAEFDIDVADNTVEAKDMWIAYQFSPHVSLKAGHFKVPFSLEELTSSRLLLLNERAYPNTFAPGRRMALGLTWWNDLLWVGLAVYGQELDDEKNKTEDEGYGNALRLVLHRNFGPLQVHLGASFAMQIPDNEGSDVEYHSEPEYKQGDSELLYVEIDNVKRITMMGVEAAVGFGGFLLQGEYIASSLSRESGSPDVSFSGWYATLSWLITGERRPYMTAEGEFGQVVPKKIGSGAWELVLRYSFINLTDQDAGLLGGKAANISIGLNWYPNPNMRLMLSYSLVDNSEYATGKNNTTYIGNDDFSTLQMRLLFFF